MTTRPDRPADAERLLAVWQQPDGFLCGSWQEIRCTLRLTQQGRPIVDVRLFRRYPRGRRWYPTRAGLQIDPSLLRDIAQTLLDAGDEYDATEGTPPNRADSPPG